MQPRLPSWSTIWGPSLQPGAQGVGAGHSAPDRDTGAPEPSGSRDPRCPCSVTGKALVGSRLSWVRCPRSVPSGRHTWQPATNSHHWRVSWLMNSWPQHPAWPMPSLVPGAGPWRAWLCCDGDTLGRQWPQQGPALNLPPTIAIWREGSRRSVGTVLARPVLSPPPTACLQPVLRRHLTPKPPTLPAGHPLCA